MVNGSFAAASASPTFWYRSSRPTTGRVKHFTAQSLPPNWRTWYTSAKFPDQTSGVPCGPTTGRPAFRSGSANPTAGFWTASLNSLGRGQLVGGGSGLGETRTTVRNERSNGARSARQEVIVTGGRRVRKKCLAGVTSALRTARRPPAWRGGGPARGRPVVA